MLNSLPLKTLISPQAIRLWDRFCPSQNHFIQIKKPRQQPRFGSVDLTLITEDAWRKLSPSRLKTLMQTRWLMVFRAPDQIAAEPGEAAPFLCDNPAINALQHESKKILPILCSGSGIWTPSLQLGIGCSAYRAHSQRSFLIIAQGCTVAEQCLQAAALKKLKVVAAISTGNEQFISWSDIALLARQDFPHTHLLIALHRPVPLAAFSRFITTCPEAGLMFTSGAEKIIQTSSWIEDDNWPKASMTAQAMGLTVAQSPDELIEAAWLKENGLIPKRGMFWALSNRVDGAALMADTLSRAQLTPFRLTTIQNANQQSSPLSAPSGDSEQDSGGDQLVECIPGNKELFRQAKEVWKKSPYDCLLFDRGQGPKLLPTPSVDHLSYEERAIPVNRATLSALSAILHLYPHYQLKCRNRPTKIHHARAYTFLDNWHAALSDVQAKQVLNCYGLRTPEEQLVTSASSAGQVASRIGLPVSVKAVGPELHRYHQSVELRYDATNVAAARDAFRRLVQTCSQMQPLPLLDGVLVSKRVEPVWGLNVILFWLPELPPLLYLDRPQQNKCIPSGQWLLRCPVSQNYARRVAHHIIFSLSSGDRLLSDGDENCAELSNAIWRLSWLGADLTGRMHWLRLSTAITNSPRGSFLLYFIDGYGSQTESLRSPNYG